MRHWVLNDEIAHHKHGFVSETVAEMNLSYKRSRNATATRIADDLKLNLPELVEEDLARKDVYDGRVGFRLRFVHDTTDHGIYIQRDGSSARRLVATLPAGLI
jgi:hypothetical protein